MVVQLKETNMNNIKQISHCKAIILTSSGTLCLVERQ